MVGSFEVGVKDGGTGAAARDRMDYCSDQGKSGSLKNADRVLHGLSLITKAGFFPPNNWFPLFVLLFQIILFCVESHTRGIRLKPSKNKQNTPSFLEISMLSIVQSCLPPVVGQTTLWYVCPL